MLEPFGFAGQGWVQPGELTLAFILSSLVGLERELLGSAEAAGDVAGAGGVEALLHEALGSTMGIASLVAPSADNNFANRFTELSGAYPRDEESLLHLRL